MKKLLIVIGTRPEAIKVAPLIKALEKDSRIQPIVVSTGQHRDMLEQVNQMFGIKPEFDLHLMRDNQTLNSLVGRAIASFDQLLDEVDPDAVLVHGDTSTAMAGCITAFNREIPVVHLEAGLRTYDLESPFPEEGNRRVIGQLAALHLAPTRVSKNNLEQEQIPAEKIVVTGNTVIDSLLMARDWEPEFSDPDLKRLVQSDRPLIMVTSHRRENIQAMAAIGGAMAQIASQLQNYSIVLPAHLNPKVRRALLPALAESDNILVTDPLPYDQFISLMNRSSFILTDSGGVQEEAPSLGKPVLVMRNNTERPEAIEAGTVKLVGTAEEQIAKAAVKLANDREFYEGMANAVNPYGDGKASFRACQAIARLFGFESEINEFHPGE